MGQDGRPQPDGNDRTTLASAFPRLEQTFPAPTSAEIERMRHFGETMTYKDGEPLFETGKPGTGMFVVLKGHVAITQRDELGHVTPVIDQGPGQFLAELGSRDGRRWWMDTPRAMSRPSCCRRIACARCWSPKPSLVSASCAR